MLLMDHGLRFGNEGRKKLENAVRSVLGRVGHKLREEHGKRCVFSTEMLLDAAECSGENSGPVQFAVLVREFHRAVGVIARQRARLKKEEHGRIEIGMPSITLSPELKAWIEKFTIDSTGGFKVADPQLKLSEQTIGDDGARDRSG
jgi:hypothetical protein